MLTDFPALSAIKDTKIVFAANSSAGQGGQGEFLRQMIFALAHLPHASVYSRSGAVEVPLEGFPWPQLRALISMPVLRRRMDWMTLLSDLQFDRAVVSRVGRPDVFDGVMAQCANTLEYLRPQGKKLVLTCLNTHIDNLIDVVEAEHRKVGYRGHHFFHPMMRKRSLREIESAGYIRVTSEWAKHTFVERGVSASKLRVIYPAVDLEHFKPVSKKDGIFRVLAVASIDPRKGIHYLLQAFEQARIPRSELVLIGGTGDPWSKQMLREFQSRNPNITQRFMDVTTTPIVESYGSASVLVHPAIEDGYGLVVAQALACGRPAIVTRQSGVSELIRDGQNGFVVESRSVEQLRDRLQLLASDRRLVEQMGERAPASVAHLGYEAFARNLLGFYREVLL
jgi:glycosyltransferase involved in cell wall biosynthesis